MKVIIAKRFKVAFNPNNYLTNGECSEASSETENKCL